MVCCMRMQLDVIVQPPYAPMIYDDMQVRGRACVGTVILHKLYYSHPLERQRPLFFHYFLHGSFFVTFFRRATKPVQSPF